MKQVPTGTELARPFIPARDFLLSKNFYETLGFEKLLDGDVAISGQAPAVSYFSPIIKKTGQKTL